MSAKVVHWSFKFISVFLWRSCPGSVAVIYMYAGAGMLRYNLSINQYCLFTTTTLYVL